MNSSDASLVKKYTELWETGRYMAQSKVFTNDWKLSDRGFISLETFLASNHAKIGVGKCTSLSFHAVSNYTTVVAAYSLRHMYTGHNCKHSTAETTHGSVFTRTGKQHPRAPVVSLHVPTGLRQEVQHAQTKGFLRMVNITSRASSS